MRFKRIVIFSTSAHVYGAERGLLLFLRWGLRRKLFSRAFVFIPQPGPLQHILAGYPEVTVVVSPFSYTISRDLWTLIASAVMYPFMLTYCLYFIARHKINAVVSNTTCISVSLPLAMIMPHVFFVREVFNNCFFCFWQRQVSRFSYATLTVSAYVQKSVTLVRPEAVPEPVDTLFFQRYRRSVARAQLRIPAHYTVLAVIGRIHPAKGQKEFFRLLELIPRSATQRAVILVVGDENSAQPRLRAYKEDLLEQIGSSSHADSIRFVGYVQDMGRIYAAADVCIFPYQRDEFYGYSILEAAFFKKKVLLAHPGGGISEYLPDPAAIPVLNEQNLLKSLISSGEIPVLPARFPALQGYLRILERLFR